MKINNSILRFDQLSRDNLYVLIQQEMSQSISITDFDFKSDKCDYHGDSKDIRFQEHKLLLLNFLFDPFLGQQLSVMKNSKYDYLIGLLFFISAQKNFNYNYSYFLENIESYNQILENWNNLLDTIIKDINVLPTLNSNYRFTLLINDLLLIDLFEQSIERVYVNLSKFNQVFNVRSFDYNYGLYLYSENDKRNQLVISGQSNGTGRKSHLFVAFKRINKILDESLEYQKLLINASHEN